jgi:hypothetical protein
MASGGLSQHRNVKHGTQCGRAQRLADEAQEHDGGRRGTALTPWHRGLDRDNEGGIAQSHSNADQ